MNKSIAIEAATEKMCRDSDKRTGAISGQFKEGQIVYLDRQGRKAKGDKIKPPYNGPFTVCLFFSHNITFEAPIAFPYTGAEGSATWRLHAPGEGLPCLCLTAQGPKRLRLEGLRCPSCGRRYHVFLPSLRGKH